MRESRSRGAERLAWEASVGWDHPLVKAGLCPAHLLRESFGYSNRRSFGNWCREHAYLGVKVNHRLWFCMPNLVKWFENQVTLEG